MSDTNTLPTPSASRLPRTALLAAGGVALAGLGLAAGLMLRAPSSAPAASSGPAPVSAMSDTQAPAPVVMQQAQPGANREAPHRVATGPDASRNLQRQPAAVACATCGVIESVRAVQQKGQGSGVGAVAGGVVGGVVGNSMGGGNGKTALTVLGAIGGGMAGHEIEKRARSTTVYEVRVRMDDGSVRTVTQGSAPAAGTRVSVEGQKLHTIGGGNTGAAQQQQPRLMQTSGQGST